MSREIFAFNRNGLLGFCVPSSLARINHRRYTIEERSRLLETDFKARPVYLSRDDRIRAHFTACLLTLTLYRYLEKS